MLMENQVTVVTGGSSGLGRAICERFAEEGARAIIVADISETPREGGTSIVELLSNTGCDVRFVKADVSNLGDIAKAVDAAEAFGGVTTMVNNAGVLGGYDFLQTEEAEYDRTLSINAKGVFFGAQIAARSMVKRGTKGSIINMSSLAGIRGHGEDVSYSASKGAIQAMTYAMANNLGPRGIRVNAIHPGDVQTSMSEENDPRDLAWTIPLGRMGQPRNVGDAAVFLASALSSYITATSLIVDGGIGNTWKGSALPRHVAG